MSPQPTAPRRTADETPNETPEAATNGDGSTTEAERAAAIQSLRELAEHDSPGGRQIRRAIMLEGQRADHQVLVTKNRDYLRLMKVNDELTEAQSKAVEVFYPEKEKDARRDKEDIEATRKLKEAARTLASTFAKEAAEKKD